jgi:hypothetical protein
VGAAGEITQSPERRLEVQIKDADLLESWNTLRSLQNPVSLWNGETVSGAELAQFLLEAQIPVMWGTDEICGGGSCSRQYCSMDGDCSFEDGKPGIDPIYINPSVRNQTTGKASRLVNELAHEIFHRTQPFGTGPDTQLEEYWAFYVGAQVSGGSYLEFTGIDPLDPPQLQSWFSHPGMQGYLKLDAYPERIAHSTQNAAVQPDPAGVNLDPIVSE